MVMRSFGMASERGGAYTRGCDLQQVSPPELANPAA
jgi:hypothetical protein